jgi:predicted short-subunit dehydrogenase-like oxidoreductase (DUF2520 family)
VRGRERFSADHLTLPGQAGSRARALEAGPTRVGIVGAGRLGTALAEALRATGIEVDGPLGRGQAPVAETILLCVPDSEIESAAEVVAGHAGLVGHTSGASPLSVLAPAEQAGSALFGLHPLQTFAGGEVDRSARAATVATADGTRPAALARFAGAGCAIAGSTPEALNVAELLARRLGMTPFEIRDEQRAAYHAAASVASNFLVTLQAAAEEIAGGAGLEPEEARALLAPLVRASVENWAARGPERALTGPVARGDEATVERQRDAIERGAPRLLPLFDELARQTRVLAGREVPA